MKYIVEIKPEYEDSFKGVMILVAKDSNLFVDALAVEDLEELTADYINEHYGQLQDDAYQRGLEDGKRLAVGAAELREKLEYQKGFEDGRAQVERGCEGCKYEDRTSGQEPCYRCARNADDCWTAKDDKIEVGDEVNWSSDCFIVTRIFQPRNMKEQCDGIDDDGCTYHDVLMDDLEKTGRHFDIDKILEDMRND